MTIKLSRLLEEIKPLEVIGETDKNIESLQSDSRKVGKGGMFVAVRGVTTDGHRYIPVVASAHVAAIVCEDLPASIEKGITYIRVADSAEAPGSPRLGLVRTPLVATSARGRDGHQRQDHHRHPTLRDGKTRGLQGRPFVDGVQLYPGPCHTDHTHHSRSSYPSTSFSPKWCRPAATMPSWKFRAMQPSSAA